jgi:L-amino acid N-acyltransferase YncA
MGPSGQVAMKGPPRSPYTFPARHNRPHPVNIRSATLHDADAFAEIYAPIVLETAISFEWTPPTADDFRARIAKVGAKYPWLVAEDDNAHVAGFVYASSHRDPPSYQWSVNTSVFIRADARGQGVGTALYEELHRQLVERGYYRAYAGIALPNLGSVALHESVGYRLLGIYEKVGFKFGQWRDVGWWQKELQPCVGEPTPPRAG